MFASQKPSTYTTTESIDCSLENLSSLGFFLETLVKFNGTRKALSQVVFSVCGNFSQFAQLGLPNKCWLFAVKDIKAKVMNKRLSIRVCMNGYKKDTFVLTCCKGLVNVPQYIVQGF